MINERFALECVLDQVRFGTLYRAIDLDRAVGSNRPLIAVWVLPSELTHSAAALAAFERDFERIKTLDHPNIGRVFARGRDGDRWFVTMEYLDGETLRSVLEQLQPERLGQEEVDAIVLAVASGLAHAHSRGIAHGDVRAENVIITMDHDVKLVNFMTTSVLREAPLPAEPADDVRDLAALAYELYSGEPPLDRHYARIKGLPKRRWSALDAALRGAIVDADEFLLRAGFGSGVRPLQAPDRRAPRSKDTVRRPGARRWRHVLPVAAGLTAALWLTNDGAGWLAAALNGVRLGPRTSETASARRPALARSVSDYDEAEQRRGDPAADPGPTEPPKPAPVEQQRVLPVAAMPRERGAPLAAVPPRDDPASEASRGRAVISLSARAVRVREDQLVATIDIERSGSADSAVEVIWYTSDGTASSLDDYASFGKRLETLAAGQTTRRLQIPIAADDLPEPDEYFYVHLDPKMQGADAGSVTDAKVTIVDDDL